MSQEYYHLSKEIAVILHPFVESSLGLNDFIMKTLFTIISSMMVSATMAQTMFNLDVSTENYYPVNAPYTVSMPGWDNDPIEHQQLGFEFTFHGKKYTEFHISPNGNIYFGTDPLASVIDPFGCDLWDNPNDGDTASIVVKTVGTAGKAVKVIEWRNARFKKGAESDIANFQIRLFEETGNIHFVYGNIVASEGAFGESTGSFCGVWDDPAKTYIFLHGDVSSPAVDRTFKLPFPTLDGVPAEGTKYGFTSVVNGVSPVKPLPLNLYPNPTQGNVTIQLENEAIASLNVYTLTGKKVQINHVQEGNQIQLRTAELPAGTYLVRIEDTDAVRVARLMVSK